MKIHLATSAAHAGLAPDDRHLLAALRARGADAEPVVWEDPLVDWSEARVCCVRSTWDYTFRREAFLEWADRVAHATTLCNPAAAIDWSTHKSYLLRLHEAGVPTVPTTLVTRGSAFDLEGHVHDRGWPEIVVKPAVGASGQWARCFGHHQLSAAQAHVDRIASLGDVLVQPLLPAITVEGELSAVCIDGEVTHVVRKRGATGDFRVHDDHGGGVTPEPVTPVVRELVARALEVAPVSVTYARVDLVPGLDEQLAVMELELVEPELFFRFSPEGTARLADALLCLGAD